jgi:hypothetical protein
MQERKMRRLIYILVSLLCLSLSFNLFQFTNAEVTCKKIDKRWKADLLYKMGHHKLDGDHDGIPCEALHNN